MLHTTIIHELREKHELTIHEYCVLEAVAFLSANPKSPVAGWCCASKAYIAKALGVSKAFVVDAISTLGERGLVEKSVDGRLVRTSSLYYDERQRHADENGRNKTNGKRTDRPTVVEVTDNGKQSDLDRSDKRPPSKILSNISDKDNNSLALQVIDAVDELRFQYGVSEKKIPLVKSRKRIKLIEARIRDFKTTWPDAQDVLKAVKWMLQYKAREWTGDDMWRYFSISTLFSDKHFLDYCEECKMNGGNPPAPKAVKKPQPMDTPTVASSPESYHTTPRQ